MDIYDVLIVAFSAIGIALVAVPLGLASGRRAGFAIAFGLGIATFGYLAACGGFEGTAKGPSTEIVLHVDEKVHGS